MDCGLVHCVASLRPLKQKSTKKFGSQKYGEIEVEPEREWPVNPEEYELLHQAGKGAHAVVCCARCKPFDEIVAVKKLDLDAKCNYDLSALTREATLMKKLQHPNVLQLHTSFVAGRELWMVMPYMEHGSLRSIMKQEHFKEGLDEVVIATIMRGVLEGLDYVHRNGGIHRDIKADNILLSATGEVRLADFGVAAARARPVSMVNLDVVSVMATTFVGTPCWMAPEVMSQEEGYNSSADIWSFGITIIELATGRPPLARAHPMRVIMDTINNPAPSLDDHPAGHVYSKCMKEVVDACLNKNPFERPSASDLLEYKFFRMAKDQDFLVEHFLAGLKPPPQIPVLRAAAAGGLGRQPSGPELLAGILRNKSALGLQDLAIGRITSRIKSSWYFPGAKSLANMAQLKKEYRASDESLSTHDEEDEEPEPEEDKATAGVAAAAGGQPSEGTTHAAAAAAQATAEQQVEEVAEALAADIASRTSSQMGSFTAGSLTTLLPEPKKHLSSSLAESYPAVQSRPLSSGLGFQVWDACNWIPKQQETAMQISSASITKPAQQSAMQQHEQVPGTGTQPIMPADMDGCQRWHYQQQGSHLSTAAGNGLVDHDEKCYVEVEVVVPDRQTASKQLAQSGTGKAVITGC